MANRGPTSQTRSFVNKVLQKRYHTYLLSTVSGYFCTAMAGSSSCDLKPLLSCPSRSTNPCSRIQVMCVRRLFNNAQDSLRPFPGGQRHLIGYYWAHSVCATSTTLETILLNTKHLPSTVSLQRPQTSMISCYPHNSLAKLLLTLLLPLFG